MKEYKTTEIILGNDRLSCFITDEFEEGERERQFVRGDLSQKVELNQVITDAHGRNYLVTDIIIQPDDPVRRIRVTPIDFDGEDF